jgi:hypothetical protein
MSNHDAFGDAEMGLEAGSRTASATMLEEANSLLTGHEISGNSNDPSHWTNKVAVRSADVVMFQFCHISLPHQLPALRECLGILLPNLTSSQAAENVHSLFGEEGFFISTSSLKEIESLWTKCPLMSSNNEQEVVLLVLVRVHTCFRKVDWRITRSLICVTCTQETADSLSEISRRPRMLPIGETSWIAAIAQPSTFLCNQVSLAKWPTRFFATFSAIEAVSLALKCVLSWATYGLPKGGFPLWCKAKYSLLFESVQGGGNFAQCRRSSQVLQSNKPGSFSPIELQTHHLVRESVIMLLKSDQFPSEAQDCCLLLLGPLKYPYKASLVAWIKWARLFPVTEWTLPSDLAKSKQQYLGEFCNYLVGVLEEEASDGTM